MTTTIENPPQAKKTRPTDEIFPVTDGKIKRDGRIPVWSSKNGKAKSFRVNGQLYVIFPAKSKPAAQEGA